MIEFSNPAAAGPYLPHFFSEDDPRSAREQLNENYVYGGVRSFEGFTLRESGGGYCLDYPEDPPTREIARAKLRDETIVLFQHSWVAIIQPDGSFIVTRCD